MVHSHSPQSSAFNSKLNQKKAKPLSSFLSSARTPLRDLPANVEDPNRKPNNDGKAAVKGNDSLKKPLRVLDNIQPKKVEPKRSQNVTSGAVGHRTDRQRTAARSKPSDHRPFKVYDDASEEQVASMRTRRSSARDEAIGKLPGFEDLTEYFPDRVQEIQHFYRQKEHRRLKAIESMMLQNTRQTKHEAGSAVPSTDLRREPTERNGFGGLPVDKHLGCSSENKYGAIGQTKNGYAPGVCARQRGPKQAVIQQRISYETEELLRMNFLVCGNLCHSKTQTRNKKGVRSNVAHGTAIRTRR
ncbi:uncharacterized protein LOC126576988 [Anopheles aquasalis]|uniref:uncharacterized protein LOC126576988 n=1 Tax=Anopheles aquasalis TaxID=42839 RepID=UPI00215A7305|nr:uncharacterized protein LOC126576988 [Anopheles aquasalis]